MAKIRIVIAPDGNASVLVNGIKGKSCKDVTKAFEQALGKVTSDQPTGEMYEQPIVQDVNQS